MPEGAALFRPTYMGIGGGVVFGGALHQPENPLPKIKNVGWKSAAPSTNAKALNGPKILPKQTMPTYQKKHNFSSNIFVYMW